MTYNLWKVILPSIFKTIGYMIMKLLHFESVWPIVNVGTFICDIYFTIQ